MIDYTEKELLTVTTTGKVHVVDCTRADPERFNADHVTWYISPYSDLGFDVFDWQLHVQIRCLSLFIVSCWTHKTMLETHDNLLES